MPKIDRPRDQRRQRIPHGKLLPASSIKSGMTIWHDFMWRSVWRASFDGQHVRFMFSSGVGSMGRASGKYEPDQLIAARITIRAARRTL